MPHAIEDTMTLTNGDASSKFLSHLNSYPVVSDGVETFKSNPYGKKSIDLGTSAYQRFAKPVEPYLETPYSYAKPYVAKADELASSGLGHVETHFPIVKEDTTTIVDKGKSIIWYPFKLADDGKTYLVQTWQDEYKKTASHKSRGDGLPTLILALVSTQLKLASDFFQVIADFLGPRYEDGKTKAQNAVQQAQETAEGYTQYGKEKLNDLQKKGDQYTKEAQKKGDEYTKEAQKKGEEYTNKAQDKAGELQKEGEKKVDGAKQEAQSKKEEVKSKAQK